MYPSNEMSKDSYSTIEDAAVTENVANDDTNMSHDSSISRTTAFKAFVGKSKDRLLIGGFVGILVLSSALLIIYYTSGKSSDVSTSNLTKSGLSTCLFESTSSSPQVPASKSLETPISVSVSKESSVPPVVASVAHYETPYKHSDSKKHRHHLPPLCSFDECYAASCDVDTAPFTCVKHNGGPHGGCSSRPWTKDTCDHQCDLSFCDSVHIPRSEGSCKHIKCHKEWCASSNTLLCPEAAPYQCLEGSAKFGCTTDLDLWGFKTASTTCSKCCDSVTCDDDEY